MSVIKLDTVKNNSSQSGMFIDTSKLRASCKDIILPQREEIEDKPLAPNHAAQPIKSARDIMRLSQYFLDNGKYRDNMLFILGINFGLRISDILELRFCDLINPDFTFKDFITVFEKKTRNTRKKSQNRIITINSCVQDAIITYLENTPNISLSDYMFVNESGNNKYFLNGRNEKSSLNRLSTPMTRQGVDLMLKNATKAIGLDGNYATHTLRKTFAYHYMLQNHNDTRALELLQKMFNHSSIRQTLTYIGITDEEIEEAYHSLGNYYDNILINSSIKKVTNCSVDINNEDINNEDIVINKAM
jgi:site-specific recombinase XerD